jgi:hypothetical protein
MPSEPNYPQSRRGKPVESRLRLRLATLRTGGPLADRPVRTGIVSLARFA